MRPLYREYDNDNIKTDLREKGFIKVYWIHLARVRPNVGTLQTL
jgi:hypothetical protein